jgi:hypothetical protein
VIALSIVAALLAIAFGGLRVALSAWNRGEARAEVHQHARSLATMLARSIAAAHPYRIARSDSPEPVIQFDGYSDRLDFVTRDAPFPLQASIAFTAVTLNVESGEKSGLAVRERALPNRDIFADAEPVLRDPAVTALGFRYLTPEGTWEDRWDGAEKQALPAAVEVTLDASLDGRSRTRLPVTVALRVVTATQ